MLNCFGNSVFFICPYLLLFASTPNQKLENPSWISGFMPTLKEIQTYCREQVDTLWDEVKRFDNPHSYYVDLSKKLWDIKYNLLKNNSK